MKSHDTHFLEQAILLSKQSTEPVQCASILVDQTQNIIAKEINTQRKDGSITSHAELKAIQVANRRLGRMLNGTTV